MIATSKDLPSCTSCGRDAFVAVARGAACAQCLRNLCASALTAWESWFAGPAPDHLQSTVLGQHAAETHADLGVAYAEMGLTADALAELVIAIASSDSVTVPAGSFVLDHLSPAGWKYFASGAVASH